MYEIIIFCPILNNTKREIEGKEVSDRKQIRQENRRNVYLIIIIIVIIIIIIMYKI